MADNSNFYYYRITLQYVGTNYKGWQIQQNVSTVQGELNKVLQVISKNHEVKSIASGRTDAGVHALGQVVKIGITLKIAKEGLLKALNSLLPADIRVLEIEDSDYAFHPTYHCKEKEYHYLFSNNPLTPFAAPYMASFSYPIDFEKMKQAAELFVGEYDFKNFYCFGTDVGSTVRTIYRCSIQKCGTQGFCQNFSSEYYALEIVGNGFLKQMVRSVVGALWEVARHKASLDDIKQALSPLPKSKKIGKVAPPEGLYLIRASY